MKSSAIFCGRGHERQPPRRHLVDADAQRVDVALAADHALLDLRRHVHRRAHDGLGLRRAGKGAHSPGAGEAAAPVLSPNERAMPKSISSTWPLP